MGITTKTKRITLVGGFALYLCMKDEEKYEAAENLSRLMLASGLAFNTTGAASSRRGRPRTGFLGRLRKRDISTIGISVDSVAEASELQLKPSDELRQAMTKMLLDRHEEHQKSRRRTGASFYGSKAWLSVRYAVLSERGGRCECCGASAKDGVKLQVDHIKPRSKYPELELEKSNLQVLCKACNMGKSNRHEDDWRKDKPKRILLKK